MQVANQLVHIVPTCQRQAAIPQSSGYANSAYTVWGFEYAVYT